MLATLRPAAEERDQGFTLIELLVVIIIIGILAAIAIPVFLNQREKAQAASVKSDLRTIANEMETYYADNNTYPAVAVGSGSVTVGTEVVTLSPGNVAMAGSINPGTFCVAAMNQYVGVSSTLYYSSAQGGILPKGQVCT